MSNIVIIILGIGIIQSGLFTLLLLSKKQKEFADGVLLAWFICFAIHLSAIILLKDENHPAFILIIAKVFTLTYGPLLFLYTQTVFDGKLHFKDITHFAPFIIAWFVGSVVTPNTLDIWEITLFIAKVISMLAYPFFTLYWFNKKIEYLKNRRSDDFVVQSAWIKTLCWLLLINVTIGGLHVLADVLLNIKFSDLFDILSLVAIITTMGFYGLRFGVVYKPDLVSLPLKQSKSYKHSPLKSAEIDSISQKINQVFEETQAYLETDFSLSTLSDLVKVPKHHLSEIINKEMGSTFYDLVNEKRIEYAIKRMQDQNAHHLTLEGIGYEAGFNTKSAFYHHFKIYTGKTPGKFKSEISTD